MPNQPNTKLILTTLQTMCRGLQVNNATFFASSSVIIGKAKDVTNLVPLCEITLAKDMTKRYSLGSGVVQGGKIDDSQQYLLEITLDNTDAQTVETTTLPGIRDALTQLFHTSAALNLLGQVAYSGLEGEGEYGFSFRNGQWWRCYKTRLHVRYEYSVIVQP